MIVTRGTVISTQSGSSVIKFEYAKCTGCTNDQCFRTKRNEFLHPELMTIGSNVLLNIRSFGLSIALLILLGVPMLTFALSFTLTKSVLWTFVLMVITLFANVGLFRQFGLADYLLRPTIRRIN